MRILASIRWGSLCSKLFNRVSEFVVSQFCRTTAVVTTVCFVLTAVCGQAIAAISQDQQSTAYYEKTVSGFALPNTVGRVTDAKFRGSDTVVIAIQDLHCHPEVQKNISSILSFLNSQYKADNVYLEGAWGTVDTGWLTAIKDKAIRQAITESLVNSGQLTGVEYFAANNGSSCNVRGIEDEKIYKENSLRLKGIMDNRGDVDAILAEVNRNVTAARARYYNTRQNKMEDMVARHKAGTLESGKYYRMLTKYGKSLQLPVDAYTNINGFLNLLELERGINYKKLSKELNEYVKVLRQTLPYAAYQSLVERTSNFTKVDELYMALAGLSKTYQVPIDSRFPEVARFFRYLETGKQVNPLALIKEENHLVSNINYALSVNKTQQEIISLCDLSRCFNDFYTNKITAEDYDYFTANLKEFNLLYEVYGSRETLARLQPYYTLYNDYYKANIERNTCFINNILGNNPARTAGTSAAASGSEADKVCTSLLTAKNIRVVVTGGFHTAGLTRLLDKNAVSYLTITPSVTEAAKKADMVYARILEQQNRILSNAFALIALSLQPNNVKLQKLAGAALATLVAKMDSGAINREQLIQQMNVYLSKPADYLSEAKNANIENAEDLSSKSGNFADFTKDTNGNYTFDLTVDNSRATYIFDTILGTVRRTDEPAPSTMDDGSNKGGDKKIGVITTISKVLLIVLVMLLPFNGYGEVDRHGTTPIINTKNLAFDEKLMIWAEQYFPRMTLWDLRKILRYDFTGKWVLDRPDLNVTIKDGLIKDDERIKASLDTLEYLSSNKAITFVAAHLGKPQKDALKETDEAAWREKYDYDMGVVVQDLQAKLPKKTIHYNAAWATPEDVAAAIKAGSVTLKPGDIVVLNNVRLAAEEEKLAKLDAALEKAEKSGDAAAIEKAKKDIAKVEAFTKKMYHGISVFVQDGMGVAHRKHVSTAGAPKNIYRVAGFGLVNDIRTLADLMMKDNVTLITGGAKVDEKIEVLSDMGPNPKVTQILPGGGILNLLLRARDIKIAKSLGSDDETFGEHITALKALLQAHPEIKDKKVVWPEYVTVISGNKLDKTAEHAQCRINYKNNQIEWAGNGAVPGWFSAEDWMIVDVTPKEYVGAIEKLDKNSGVFMNGTIGVSDLLPFAEEGTSAIIKALVQAGHEKGVYALTGGGDALAARKQFAENMAKELGYAPGIGEGTIQVATGGGSALEYLRGKDLPGITELSDKPKATAISNWKGPLNVIATACILLCSFIMFSPAGAEEESKEPVIINTKKTSDDNYLDAILKKTKEGQATIAGIGATAFKEGKPTGWVASLFQRFAWNNVHILNVGSSSGRDKSEAAKQCIVANCGSSSHLSINPMTNDEAAQKSDIIAVGVPEQAIIETILKLRRQGIQNKLIWVFGVPMGALKPVIANDKPVLGYKSDTAKLFDEALEGAAQSLAKDRMTQEDYNVLIKEIKEYQGICKGAQSMGEIVALIMQGTNNVVVNTGNNVPAFKLGNRNAVTGFDVDVCTDNEMAYEIACTLLTQADPTLKPRSRQPLLNYDRTSVSSSPSRNMESRTPVFAVFAILLYLGLDEFDALRPRLNELYEQKASGAISLDEMKRQVEDLALPIIYPEFKALNDAEKKAVRGYVLDVHKQWEKRQIKTDDLHRLVSLLGYLGNDNYESVRPRVDLLFKSLNAGIIKFPVFEARIEEMMIALQELSPGQRLALEAGEAEGTVVPDTVKSRMGQLRAQVATTIKDQLRTNKEEELIEKAAAAFRGTDRRIHDDAVRGGKVDRAQEYLRKLIDFSIGKNFILPLLVGIIAIAAFGNMIGFSGPASLIASGLGIVGAVQFSKFNSGYISENKIRIVLGWIDRIAEVELVEENAIAELARLRKEEKGRELILEAAERARTAKKAVNLLRQLLQTKNSDRPEALNIAILAEKHDELLHLLDDLGFVIDGTWLYSTPLQTRKYIDSRSDSNTKTSVELVKDNGEDLSQELSLERMNERNLILEKSVKRVGHSMDRFANDKSVRAGCLLLWDGICREFTMDKENSKTQDPSSVEKKTNRTSSYFSLILPVALLSVTAIPVFAPATQTVVQTSAVFAIALVVIFSAIHYYFSLKEEKRVDEIAAKTSRIAQVQERVNEIVNSMKGKNFILPLLAVVIAIAAFGNLIGFGGPAALLASGLGIVGAVKISEESTKNVLEEKIKELKSNIVNLKNMKDALVLSLTFADRLKQPLSEVTNGKIVNIEKLISENLSEIKRIQNLLSAKTDVPKTQYFGIAAPVMALSTMYLFSSATQTAVQTAQPLNIMAILPSLIAHLPLAVFLVGAYLLGRSMAKRELSLKNYGITLTALLALASLPAIQILEDFGHMSMTLFQSNPFVYSWCLFAVTIAMAVAYGIPTMALAISHVETPDKARRNNILYFLGAAGIIAAGSIAGFWPSVFVMPIFGMFGLAMISNRPDKDSYLFSPRSNLAGLKSQRDDIIGKIESKKAIISMLNENIEGMNAVIDKTPEEDRTDLNIADYSKQRNALVEQLTHETSILDKLNNDFDEMKSRIANLENTPKAETDRLSFELFKVGMLNIIPLRPLIQHPVPEVLKGTPIAKKTVIMVGSIEENDARMRMNLMGRAGGNVLRFKLQPSGLGQDSMEGSMGEKIHTFHLGEIPVDVLVRRITDRGSEVALVDFYPVPEKVVDENGSPIIPYGSVIFDNDKWYECAQEYIELLNETNGEWKKELEAACGFERIIDPAVMEMHLKPSADYVPGEALRNIAIVTPEYLEKNAEEEVTFDSVLTEMLSYVPELQSKEAESGVMGGFSGISYKEEVDGKNVENDIRRLRYTLVLLNKKGIALKLTGVENRRWLEYKSLLEGISSPVIVTIDEIDLDLIKALHSAGFHVIIDLSKMDNLAVNKLNQIKITDSEMHIYCIPSKDNSDAVKAICQKRKFIFELPNWTNDTPIPQEQGLLVSLDKEPGTGTVKDRTNGLEEIVRKNVYDITLSKEDLCELGFLDWFAIKILNTLAAIRMENFPEFLLSKEKNTARSIIEKSGSTKDQSRTAFKSLIKASKDGDVSLYQILDAYKAYKAGSQEEKAAFEKGAYFDTFDKMIKDAGLGNTKEWLPIISHVNALKAKVAAGQGEQATEKMAVFIEEVMICVVNKAYPSETAYERSSDIQHDRLMRWQVFSQFVNDAKIGFKMRFPANMSNDDDKRLAEMIAVKDVLIPAGMLNEARSLLLRAAAEINQPSVPEYVTFGVRANHTAWQLMYAESLYAYKEATKNDPFMDRTDFRDALRKAIDNHSQLSKETRLGTLGMLYNALMIAEEMDTKDTEMAKNHKNLATKVQRKVNSLFRDFQYAHTIDDLSNSAAFEITPLMLISLSHTGDQSKKVFEMIKGQYTPYGIKVAPGKLVASLVPFYIYAAATIGDDSESEAADKARILAAIAEELGPITIMETLHMLELYADRKTIVEQVKDAGAQSMDTFKAMLAAA